ncbi:MAG: ATP-binding protein [Pseudomonadota bacterium]
MAVTFIDISVHPMVRPHVVASHPALVWSRDMSALLWANAEGARLMGEARISHLLDLEFPASASQSTAAALAAQMAQAARAISEGSEQQLSFGLRKNDGLVRFTLEGNAQSISLDSDGDALLMVFEGGHRLGLVRPGDQPADATEALLSLFEDQPGCAAILDVDGSLVADRGGMELVRFRQSDLAALHRDVQVEQDGLIKRVVRSDAGAHPAGIALLDNGQSLVLLAGDVLPDVPSTLLPDDEDDDQEINIYREPSAFARRTKEPQDSSAPKTVQLADMERIRRALTGRSDEPVDGAQDGDFEVNVEAESVEGEKVQTERAEEMAATADTPSPSAENSAPADAQPPDAGQSFFGGLDYWYFRQPRGERAPSITQPNTSQPDAEAREDHDMAAVAALVAEHEAQIVDAQSIDPDDERTPSADRAVAETSAFEGSSQGEEAEEVYEPDLVSEELTDVPVTAGDAEGGSEPAVGSEPDNGPEDGPEDGSEDEPTKPEPEHQPETGVPARSAVELVRFAFTADAEGRILSTSPEFAAIVGAQADPKGHSWSQVRQSLGVDHDGRVAAALEARDTWSGKQLTWPIAGTDRQVPVELGALPNFSRAEGFTGFRGFGVLQTSEERVDPHERGLAISWPAELDDEDEHPIDEVEEQAVSTDQDDEDVDFDMVAMRDIEADVFSGTQTKSLGEAGSSVVEFVRSATDDVEEISDVSAQPEGLTPEEAEDLSEAAEEIFDLAEAAEPEPLAHLADPNEVAGSPQRGTLEEAAQDAELEAEILAFQTSSGSEADRTIPAELQERFDTFEEAEGPVLCYRNERILFANQTLLTMTGYESAAAIDAAGGLSALLDGEGHASDAMILTCADGRQLPVSAHLKSIRWPDTGDEVDGEPNKALVISLTPQLEQGQSDGASAPAPVEDDLSATLRLGLSVPQLHEVLATATDGVVVLNAEGQIHALNGSAEALFGFESESLAGRSFATLFAPDSQPDAESYLSAMMSSGVEAVLNDGRELTGFEASGGLIPLFVTLGRLAGTGERVAGGFCAVLRDITQWKKVERELVEARQEAEEANSKKSQFLAQISHEIRTPLNAIIGFSEVMAEERFGPLGSARYGEYLRDINRSGTHVLDLINDLLDISKIESGGLDLEPQEVDLNEVVASCVSLMQPEASTERVIMRTSLSASVPRVLADPKSLRQIALNLLSNAVKFTSEGGQVIISTARMRTGEVELRIRDTGVGMSREELEQALKPYRQLSNGLGARDGLSSNETIAEGRRGTGLGLPLTKAMVEANGAEFAIHSEPGQGTWVVVAFPTERVIGT